MADGYAAAEDADGLLVMTDWDEFAQMDLARLRLAMRHPLVIDCVGVLQRRRTEMDGIEYVAIGR